MFAKLFSGPVRAALGGVFAALGGLSLYNLTSRPTSQTIAGISNTVLIAVAGSVVLIVYLMPKSRRPKI